MKDFKTIAKYAGLTALAFWSIRLLAKHKYLVWQIVSIGVILYGLGVVAYWIIHSLIPAERSHVDVVLKGTAFNVRWDPRDGPDRSRSGILAFGRGKLHSVVIENEVLTVHAGLSGAVELNPASN